MRKIPLNLFIMFAVSLVLSFYTLVGTQARLFKEEDITCYNPYVIDGDTFQCSKDRIRLAKIDAPEMPGHCRAGRQCTPGNPHASRDFLISLTRGKVFCQSLKKDHYDRTIARCSVNGEDISDAMVRSGYAVSRY